MVIITLNGGDIVLEVAAIVAASTSPILITTRHCYHFHRHHYLEVKLALRVIFGA
jgi:hypothetical protein